MDQIDIPDNCTVIADRDNDLYDRTEDGRWERRDTGAVFQLATIVAAFGPVRPALFQRRS